MENLEFAVTQGWTDRRRRSVAGLTVAFVASLLLHVLLFFLWPGSTGSLSETAPASASVELTLVSLPPRAARESSAPEASSPPVAPQSDAVEVQPPVEATGVRSRALVVEEPSEPQVVVPEPLDLTLPPGWVAEQEALQDSSKDLLPFNPELSKALAQARERQARSALLAARAGSLAGLDAEAFGARRDALGETVKVDDACFALRQDALDAGAPRWWRVRCGDVRDNAFLRPAPETDAVGRIVAD